MELSLRLLWYFELSMLTPFSLLRRGKHKHDFDCHDYHKHDNIDYHKHELERARFGARGSGAVDVKRLIYVSYLICLYYLFPGEGR